MRQTRLPTNQTRQAKVHEKDSINHATVSLKKGRDPEASGPRHQCFLRRVGAIRRRDAHRNATGATGSDRTGR